MDEKKTPAQVALDDQIRAAGADAAGLGAAEGWGIPRKIAVDQAPPWFRKASAIMQEALARGELAYCSHLGGGPQPVVLLAEEPRRWYCLPCFRRAQATRRCLRCGQPSGELTPEGGHEDVIQGPVITYSMVRCPACYERGPEVPDTFGRG
ncbi:hypothetical protein OG455_01075 [Kitasatospora sp. NBC_01287]|uniref:hypothetical protein n=1 Tax=Kitasatospora sp. NBC_01287 TaxID=2903573 RepID=UPI00225B31F6|nr:hypothetical protein [Kitasatospora sp. NBC_01287]MCX4744117.1 hypothetical protein [Kitasatospora sp. NBC_01287]